MTADFALSLSFDGIDLLHHAPSGWRRIGHAQVASPTLDADLAAMRDAALALAPDGLATKLVIPQDQIKYLTIDAPDATAAEVHTALEGATPYSLFDLVVDHVSANGQTHVAAVARETLREAEGFADGHGFRPVAFVAVPPENTFPQEVFFGPTDIMQELLGDGAEVTRSTPAVVTGTNLKVRPAVEQPKPPQPQTPAHFDLVIPEVTPPLPSDLTKPEPQSVEGTTVQPTLAQQRPLFAPVLFDRVIPEAHLQKKPVRPVAPQVSPAVASAVAAIGPSLAAPKRAVASAPPTTGAATPGRIAAGIALLAAIGAGLWAYTNQATVETTPIVTLEEVAPETTVEAPVEDVEAPQQVAEVIAPELAPEPEPEPRAPGLEIWASVSSLPPAPSQTAKPVLAISPSPPPSIAPLQALVMAAPDALPLPPQAPPAPPPEPVVVADAVPQTAATPAIGRVPTPDEAQEFYEATGVWQRAPRFFDQPSGVITMGFDHPEGTASYAASRNAPAALPVEIVEVVIPAPVNPPPPEVTFAQDDAGFVQATPEGVVTPEGAVVIAGLPEIPFQPRPALSEEDLARMAMLAPAPDGVVIIAGPPPFATPLRPDNLAPTPPTPSQDVASEAPDTAPGNLPAAGPGAGSVGIAGLELQDTGSVALDSIIVEEAGADDPRPQLRPTGLAPVADAATPDLTDILEGVVASDATLRFDSSTSLAVASSLRPETRPDGFGDQIASLIAQRAAERLAAAAAAQATPTPAPVAAPSVPQNSEPVPGGVARAATIEDAIPLRDINLIGVYGRPNDRRALVRLSNGRFVRVEVGSELDGGQVVAIGDDALNYVKRGRTYAIGLPDT